ncbi:MAG: stalk domain-containing protein, partial [Methanobacterium sp.]
MKRSYCKVLLTLFLMMIGFLTNQLAPVQAADSGTKVYLEDQQLTFPVQPQIIDGRTMVPLRTIFEAMGAVLEWDGSTMTATAVKDSTTVVIQIGNRSATINGQKQTLDVPPMVINGSTLAPLAFVARAFGDYVRWDGATRTVYISATDFPPDTAAAKTGSDQTIMAGNAFGNITINNGYICLQSNWIYFMNWRDCRFLYRIRTDGSGLQQISDETIWGDINVVGDWVYYNTSHSFMRVRTDGSTRQKLSDDTPNWLTVVGDWAYYS